MFTRKTTVAAVATLLLCGSAQAFTIGTGGYPFPDLLSGIPLLLLDTEGPDNSTPGYANYDPGLDLLSITSPIDAHMQFEENLGTTPIAGHLTGNFDLIMNATSDRDSAGGIFSIVASAPDLGIDNSVPLFAANVVGAQISQGGMEVLLKIDYTDPSLGSSWGSYAVLAGLLDSISACNPADPPCTPLVPPPDATEFTQPWHAGPVDYWTLEPASVPEPNTLGLLGVGLVAIGAGLLGRRTPAKV